MEINRLYYANVKDNNHPKQNGKIQIKVMEHHENTDDSLLPWARPFSLSTGGSKTHGVSNIPEINSNVWVFYSDENSGLYKKPFYIADGSLDDFNPHLLFNSNVKSSIGSSATYPNAKFYYFKNGICIGVDSSSSNPEVFIYHPMASIFIDKTGKFQIKNSAYSLKDLIDNLCDAIKSITTTGSPATHSVSLTSQTQFTLLKGQFDLLLK